MAVIVRRGLAIVTVLALARVVAAQPASPPAPETEPPRQLAPPPPTEPSAALRDANAAASAGDWQRVELAVAPLLARTLATADLAEAHRLAGLAAFFEQRPRDAETHFVAYLRLDLDGHLDPRLYPPDVRDFFDDVRGRHAAELRALRPGAKRYWLLSLLPPVAQWQNGERTKAWVIGGLLGSFAIANVTSYLVLRSWCTHVSGVGGTSVTCDATTNHARAASTLRGVNIATGVGLIITYVYGMYDGVAGYRRRTREQLAPYATPINDGAVVGVVGQF